MRRRNNYVMRRLDTPKKVTLPKSRNFYAKYQRVPRSQLPPNVIMKRRYRTRAAPKGRRRRPIRKGKRGRGFLSSLKKIAKNPLVRQIGKNALKKVIDYTPQLYNLVTNKIKNKTARKILQSDAATNLLNNLVTKYGSK